jgi:hypothetical protein
VRRCATPGCRRATHASASREHSSHRCGAFQLDLYENSNGNTVRSDIMTQHIQGAQLTQVRRLLYTQLGRHCFPCFVHTLTQHNTLSTRSDRAHASASVRHWRSIDGDCSCGHNSA